MRHPFQTDTFDPGDPALILRICMGRKLHEGFHIGSNAHEVGGERWIHLHQNYPYPCHYKFDTCFHGGLAYHLPESYGACPHLAMNAFVKLWETERRRLWALEPMPEPPPLAPSTRPAPAPKARQPRKSPMDRHIAAQAGAVPLPGLEPWTEFGRMG